jgi:hypothetical protein
MTLFRNVVTFSTIIQGVTFRNRVFYTFVLTVFHMSSHCSGMFADCLRTHLAITCDLSSYMQLFPTGAIIVHKMIKKHIGEFIF